MRLLRETTALLEAPVHSFPDYPFHLCLVFLLNPSAKEKSAHGPRKACARLNSIKTPGIDCLLLCPIWHHNAIVVRSAKYKAYAKTVQANLDRIDICSATMLMSGTTDSRSKLQMKKRCDFSRKEVR